MVLLKWNKWIQFYLLSWASLVQDGRVPCLESTVHCAEEDFFFIIYWFHVGVHEAFAWPVKRFQHLSRIDWWVSIFPPPTTARVVRLILRVCARASLYPCLWWEGCMCDMSTYACVCWYIRTWMCIHMYIHVFWQSLGSHTCHVFWGTGSSWVWSHRLDQMGQLASPRDYRQACNSRITSNTPFLLLNMRITGKPYHSWRYVDTEDWTQVPVLQGKLFTNWSISPTPKFYDFLILILFNFDEADGRKRNAFEVHHFICLGEIWLQSSLKSTYFKYSLYLWCESWFRYSDK